MRIHTSRRIKQKEPSQKVPFRDDGRAVTVSCSVVSIAVPLTSASRNHRDSRSVNRTMSEAPLMPALRTVGGPISVISMVSYRKCRRSAGPRLLQTGLGQFCERLRFSSDHIVWTGQIDVSCVTVHQGNVGKKYCFRVMERQSCTYVVCSDLLVNLRLLFCNEGKVIYASS